MRRDQVIKIARAVRNYPGGIGEVTLVWRVFYSQLGVEYRQIAVKGNMNTSVPDFCVKNHLRTFVRDQSQLQPDSYYLVAPPTEVWREIIESILKNV
jgi:hypothetical protein